MHGIGSKSLVMLNEKQLDGLNGVWSNPKPKRVLKAIHRVWLAY